MSVQFSYVAVYTHLKTEKRTSSA